MPKLDTAAIRRKLEHLRPEIAAISLEPERAGELGKRLSLMASQVTAACEVAFLALVESAAA